MQAKQVLVFLDRQQGGKLNLEKNDLNVRSVVTVNELLDILLEAGKVKKDQKAEVENFLQNNSYVQVYIQVYFIRQLKCSWNDNLS